MRGKKATLRSFGTLSPNVWWALSTISGGEVVDDASSY
jgi:hypothetical protein